MENQTINRWRWDPAYGTLYEYSREHKANLFAANAMGEVGPHRGKKSWREY